ncbi:MAG: hypothetical protein AB9834_24420 [Lentimicrobium sp.]
MIKYIHKRVWFVNHRFGTLTNISTLILINLEDQFELNIEPVKFLSTSEEIVRVRFKKPFIDKLQALSDPERKNIIFESIDAQLNSTGYAYFTIVCNFTREHFDFNLVENEISGKISRGFNECFETFNGLLTRLSDHKILIRSEVYNFGVPDALSADGSHSKFRSYLYNYSLFFINQDEDYEMQKKNLSNVSDFQVNSKYKSFTILDSVWFWSVSEQDFTRELMDELIFPNFLALTESVTYSNAIFCYSGFLDMIINNKQRNLNDIRQMININNSKLLNIKKMRPYYNSYQIAHIEHHHQFNMNNRQELYNTSYNTLNVAIDGVYSGISQKANRTIQYILAFFTLLTIYSVMYDVYSFLTTRDMQSIGIINSLIFGMVTVGLSILFFIVRRNSKYI